MPVSLADAVRQQIQAAPVAAKLGQFGGTAGVFTTQPPENAELPYVVLDQAAGSDVTTTKDGTIREVEFDLDVYAEQTGSATAIDEIASDLFDLFDRSPVSWDGWTGRISAASGPQDLRTDPDLQGRTVTVRLTIERT